MSDRNDPEGDKRRSLQFAGRLATKVERTERELAGAIVLASSTGASLREIADATGISHTQVSRIIDKYQPEGASHLARRPVR